MKSNVRKLFVFKQWQNNLSSRHHTKCPWFTKKVSLVWSPHILERLIKRGEKRRGKSALSFVIQVNKEFLARPLVVYVTCIEHFVRSCIHSFVCSFIRVSPFSRHLAKVWNISSHFISCSTRRIALFVKGFCYTRQISLILKYFRFRVISKEDVRRCWRK